MDAKPRTKFLRLIEVLVRHEVEFLIVGGVAALLEGAPILTLDLDILARRLRGEVVPSLYIGGGPEEFSSAGASPTSILPLLQPSPSQREDATSRRRK